MRWKRGWAKQKRLWDEELLSILLAYYCTPQSTTKETPFRLTYATNAMIQVEIGEPLARKAHFEEALNDEGLTFKLHMIEEMREHAQIQEKACKRRETRKHQSKLKRRKFWVSDLVWKMKEEPRKDHVEAKLAPKCERPFRIIATLQNGAHRLEELIQKVVPRPGIQHTWNHTSVRNQVLYSFSYFSLFFPSKKVGFWLKRF